MTILLLQILILLACLAVLGLQLKIYTEQLKDRKFDVREARSGHDGGRDL
jgi:hypothetical protein